MKTIGLLITKSTVVLAACAVGAGMLSPLPAHAHRSFLVPSSTVLAASDKQWVTIDAARGNDLFYFNHNAMPVDGLEIVAPDGRLVTPAKLERFRYRAVMDIQLNQQGTWKAAVVDEGLRVRWKENGEEKRWNGSRADYAKSVPANAQELTVSDAFSRVETMVTVGKPTNSKLTGKGLEVEYVTHPNDLFAGEKSTFVFYQNGKPAPDVRVTVVRGGARYQDKPLEIALQTDAQGKVIVDWKEPGMYWMNASVRGKGELPATTSSMSYAATLEVMGK